jgi:diguanylate cyclase (GGDEF)-like protein
MTLTVSPTEQLLLMVVMLQGIFAFAWWMACRIRSTEIATLHGFFLCNATMCFSMLLIALRSIYPGLWHKVVPLLLICLANYYLLVAAHAFFRLKPHAWMVSVPLATGSVGILFFVFVHFSDTYRIATFLLAVLLACALSISRISRPFIQEFGVAPLTVLYSTLLALAVPIIWTSYIALFTNRPIGLMETARLNDIAMFGLAFAITGPNLIFAAMLGIRSVKEAKQAARRDGLTALLNHQAFMAVCERDWQTRRVCGTVASALAITLDDFKKINDRYGHHVGDHVLITFSQMLQTTCDAQTVVARAGGGDFFVTLSPATPQSARALAQQLRAAALQLSWSTLIGGPSRVTLSIGIAHDESSDTKSSEWLARAERALRRAKIDGRDRVVAFGPTDP